MVSEIQPPNSLFDKASSIIEDSVLERKTLTVVVLPEGLSVDSSSLVALLRKKMHPYHLELTFTIDEYFL